MKIIGIGISIETEDFSIKSRNSFTLEVQDGLLNVKFDALEKNLWEGYIIPVNKVVYIGYGTGKERE